MVAHALVAVVSAVTFTIKNGRSRPFFVFLELRRDPVLRLTVANHGVRVNTTEEGGGIYELHDTCAHQDKPGGRTRHKSRTLQV